MYGSLVLFLIEIRVKLTTFFIHLNRLTLEVKFVHRNLFY